MLKVALVADPRREHQVAAMNAAGKGFAKHGHKPSIYTSLAGVGASDLVVTWGGRGDVNVPRLILEAGYLNGNSGEYVADRLRFISTSWNKPHGAGEFLGKVKRKRWKALGIEPADWRDKGGDYALILDQHPGDYNAPPRGVWESAIAAVDRMMPVRIRPHPLIAKSRPLEQDLAGAVLAVTWGSTAAVEAILAGIPTYALSEQAIVRPVAAHKLAEAPITPDRYDWLCELACRQWRSEELASGEFLECIGWPEGLDIG